MTKIYFRIPANKNRETGSWLSPFDIYYGRVRIGHKVIKNDTE